MSKGHHRKQRDWTLAVLIGAIVLLWGAIGVAKALTGPHPVALQQPVIIHHFIRPKPVVSHPVSPPAPKVIVHTVSQGDSLWSIAYQYCHDGSDYKKIIQANNLKSLVIQPGEKMRIEC